MANGQPVAEAEAENPAVCICAHGAARNAGTGEYPFTAQMRVRPRFARPRGCNWLSGDCVGHLAGRGAQGTQQPLGVAPI